MKILEQTDKGITYITTTVIGDEGKSAAKAQEGSPAEGTGETNSNAQTSNLAQNDANAAKRSPDKEANDWNVDDEDWVG